MAHEYQVPSIESKCMAILESWLSESTENISALHDDGTLKKIITCLDILDISMTFNITKIKDVAIQKIARFGVELYTKGTCNKKGSIVRKSDLSALQIKCYDKFEKLSDGCKSAIFLQRLRYIDDNKPVP